MIAEVVAGLGSVKTAYEVLKGLNAAVSEVKLLEVKTALLSALSDAQQGMLAANEAQLLCADRVRALETQINQAENWTSEAENYEAADAGQGTLAYRPKGTDDGSEPAHWLCPTCFLNRKKSYLQPQKIDIGRVETLNCHPCGLKLITSGMLYIPQNGRR